MKRSLKRIALALLALLSPCLGWGAEDITEVIAINFASERVALDTTATTTKLGYISSDESKGAQVTLDKWNNVAGQNVTATNKTVTVKSANNKQEYSLTFNIQNTYFHGNNTSAVDKLTGGYFDVPNYDNGQLPTISLAQMPTTGYDVAVILSGDGGTFSGVTVNGTTYMGDTIDGKGVTIVGNGSWGVRSSSSTLEEGKNVLYVSSQRAETLTITGLKNNGRSSIAGLMVFFREIPSSKATISGATQASAISWDPALSEELDAILTASADATVEMNGSIKVAGFITQGSSITFTAPEENAGTLTASSASINADTDVSGITASLGNVTIAKDKVLTGLASKTITSSLAGEGTYELGADAADTEYAPSWAAASTTPIKWTKGKLTFATGSNGSGYPKNAPLTVTGANAQMVLKTNTDTTGYSGGSASLTIADGAKLVVEKRDTFSRPLILNNASMTLSGDDLDSSRSIDFYGGSSLTSSGTSSITGANATANDYGDKTVGSGIIAIRRANLEIAVNDGTLSCYAQFGGADSYDNAATGVAVKKTGSGTLALYRAAANNVPVQVNAGTLKLVNDGGLSNNSYTIADGATLAVSVIADKTKTMTNTFNGPGKIVKQDAGTADLGGATFGETSPAFEVEGGMLILPAGAEGTETDGVITSRVTVAEGAKVGIRLTAAQIASSYTAKVADGTTVEFYDGTTKLESEGTTYTCPAPVWTPTAPTSTWKDTTCWTNLTDSTVPTSGNIVINTAALTEAIAVEIPSSFDTITVNGNETAITSVSFASDVTAAPAVSIVGRVAFPYELVMGDATTFTVDDEKGLLIVTVADEKTSSKNVAGLWNFGKMGSGTLTLSEQLNGGKKLHVLEGTLKFNGQPNGNYSANIEIDKNATLAIANNGNDNPVCGSGTIVNNGTISYSGTGNGRLPASVSGEGTIKVNDGTLTITQNNTYTGGTEIAADATVNITAINQLGTSGTIDVSGRLVLTPPNNYSGDVNSTAYGTAEEPRLTGTGTLEIAGSGFFVIPAGFTTSLALENKRAGGIVVPGAPGITVGTLSGTGYFRSDWGDTARTITVKQSKASTFSGYIDAYNADTRAMTLLVTKAEGVADEVDTTLTLSGNSTAAGTTLSVAEGSVVNLAGSWTQSVVGAGTVKIPTKTVTDLNLSNFADASTTLEIAGTVSGYFNNATWSVAAALKVSGTFELSNGFSSGRYTFTGPLTGDGVIRLARSAAVTDALRFAGDVSGFSGTIEVNDDNSCVVFCAADAAATLREAGKIYVASGSAALIPSGKTWKANNGVTVYGTIAGAGTIDSALTLNGGATLDATAGALTVSGDVTAEGTVNVTLPAEAAAGDDIIVCNNVADVVAKLTIDNDTLMAVANGTTIELATVACTIDGVKYNDLAAALQNANGKTVVLVADVSEIQLPAGVTLDTNGKTVTVTDIYGNALTADNGVYTSPADADYVAQVGEKKYLTLPAAIEAVAEGTTITVIANVTTTTSIEVTKTVTLDLNGQKVTINDTAANTDGNGVFWVKTGGALTINDSSADKTGTVDGNGGNAYKMAVWADGGKVTINGGTYINVNEGTDDQYDLIYVKNGGQVIINGGRFRCQTPAWTLNSHDTEEGTITVKGGAFYGFNPANCATEGPGTNWVAEGYSIVVAKNTDGSLAYLVVEAPAAATIGDVGYATIQSAVDAAEDKDTIILAENGRFALDAAIKVEGKKISINLNGAIIRMTEEDKVGDGVFYVGENGDLTIDGEGTIAAVAGADTNNDGEFETFGNNYHMAVWADGGKVTINGGTYNNVDARHKDGTTSDHFDLIYVKHGGAIVINGGHFVCETPKWTLNSHDSLAGTITVTGGTFVGFDPANCATEGKGTNWCAAGYYTCAEEETETSVTWYYVKAAEVPEITVGETPLSDVAQDILQIIAADKGVDIKEVTVADTENETFVNDALELFDDIVAVDTTTGVATIDWDFGISDITVNRDKDNAVESVTVTAKVTKGDADANQSLATFVNGVTVELYANNVKVDSCTLDTDDVVAVSFEIAATETEVFEAILGSELSVKATNTPQTDNQ